MVHETNNKSVQSKDKQKSYREIINEAREGMVTLILDSIEKNPTEWDSGWTAIDATTPINGRTNRAYNGFNSLYLYCVAKGRGYKDSRWVTFNQAKELGASVKKGEKSSPILFWELYDKNTKTEFNPLSVRDMTDKEADEYYKKYIQGVQKVSYIFNAEQCDHFPERTDELPKMTEEERTRQNVMIEEIINNSAAPIYYDGGNRAYYSPGSDSIHLPKIDAFHTMQDFYATALHEIVHSTGHESRLNRFGAYGSADSYAVEELRAELASVFMQRELGITLEGRHFENHAAYLNSWLNAVRNDKSLFFDAVRDAEKISDYVAENYLHAERRAERDARANVASDERTQEEIPIFNPDAVFSEQVDAVLSGADTKSTHIQLMKTTPPILRMVGAPNLPVLITADHIHTSTQEDANDPHKHGLSVDVIKKLPELISDPVMIMDSMSRKDSIVVVTQTVNKMNDPIIVPIEINGPAYLDGKRLRANILHSVYGKENFQRFIERNIQKGNMLYIDKEKSQELLNVPGVQFPNEIGSLDFNTIIRKTHAFVNTSAEKNHENSVGLAGEREKEARREAELRKADEETLRGIHRAQTIAQERLNEIAAANSAKSEEAAQNVQNSAELDVEQTATQESGEHKKESETANNSVQSAITAEQMPEQTLGEELAGKSTWLKIELPKDAIGGKFGNNTLIRMPEGEYAHFGLYVDSKYLKKNTEEKWTLTLGDKHNYRITNDGRRVELSGKELKDVLSGKELGRTPERYAASKKNKAALDRLAQNIPAELKALPCWGVYFTTPPKDPNKTKRDKVILSPTDGHRSKVNDPSNWTDFDTAMKYALANDKEGLSLLLTKESGFTCIDLDGCIDAEGKYNGIASKLTEELKGTYIERSVSGNGLHIFVKDDILKDGKYKSTARTADGELEVYDRAHSISLTGDMVSKTNEITKCPIATTLYLRENLGERQVSNAFSSAPTNTNRGEYRPGTDNEVLERIYKSKRGDEFRAIYSGKGYTGNKSVDDMKLANILAFFTNGDEAQCLRIMKDSGSYRPDKSDDYYMHTIRKAVDTLFARPTKGATAGAEASKNPNGRGKD